MTRKQDIIEVHPIEAECYVCKKTIPMEKLQYLGNNQYRCKSHRGATILKAGEAQKEARGKRWRITIPEIVIEIVEVTE